MASSPPSDLIPSMYPRHLEFVVQYALERTPVVERVFTDERIEAGPTVGDLINRLMTGGYPEVVVTSRHRWFTA